jgi:hypothetical protein
MNRSCVVILTRPETMEWSCVCGLVLDERDGKFHICASSKIKSFEVKADPSKFVGSYGTGE